MVYTTLFYLMIVLFSNKIKFNKWSFIFAIFFDILTIYGN
jgi:hypothetical protein